MSVLDNPANNEDIMNIEEYVVFVPLHDPSSLLVTSNMVWEVVESIQSGIPYKYGAFFEFNAMFLDSFLRRNMCNFNPTAPWEECTYYRCSVECDVKSYGKVYTISDRG